MVGLRQLGALVAVGLAAAVVPISTLSRGSAVSGRWRPLPRAPVSLIDQGAVSVWAGKQLIVVGRLTTYPQSGVTRNYVDAAYNPATGSWRRLPPPPSSVDGIYGYNAVWTGKEMLVWGQAIGVAFNPATNRWRLLPRSPMDGAALVVWTGREMIGWGGGCCGEAWSNGAAYNPSTNSWRSLAISPLHGAQEPVGAWDGRELIALVSGDNPQNGKPWPARLARAAARDARRRDRRMGWPRRPARRRLLPLRRHRPTLEAGSHRLRIQPGDQPLASARADAVRPEGLRSSLDGEAAHDLGRHNGRRRRPRPRWWATVERTLLRPGDRQLVTAPPGAAAPTHGPDRGLDGSLADRLGRSRASQLPRLHRRRLLHTRYALSGTISRR